MVFPLSVPPTPRSNCFVVSPSANRNHPRKNVIGLFIFLEVRSRHHSPRKTKDVQRKIQDYNANKMHFKRSLGNHIYHHKDRSRTSDARPHCPTKSTLRPNIITQYSLIGN
ncbi:uncharacterized protein LOC117219324 [Megalopta genalis]|uniref:uncharacterized protein LOC117219324 n=1 Tax=Megalopta genalis TaxID=115081 RepID=UPI0014430DDF|nr:uncharacterized protein LOC117219324 [Megalopta genalis]